MKQPNEQSQLLRYNQVTEMLNMSKSTIRRMEQAGLFPRPFSVGSRAVAFDRQEVMDWIEQKKNMRST